MFLFLLSDEEKKGEKRIIESFHCFWLHSSWEQINEWRSACHWLLLGPFSWWSSRSSTLFLNLSSCCDGWIWISSRVWITFVNDVFQLRARSGDWITPSPTAFASVGAFFHVFSESLEALGLRAVWCQPMNPGVCSSPAHWRTLHAATLVPPLHWPPLVRDIRSDFPFANVLWRPCLCSSPSWSAHLLEPSGSTSESSWVNWPGRVWAVVTDPLNGDGTMNHWWLLLCSRWSHPPSPRAVLSVSS